MMFAICLSSAGLCLSQECAELQHADRSALVPYLSNVHPDDNNAECVAAAIKKLTPERFEPAIPVLARLLDFRRPLTQDEKGGFFLRPMIVEELYPAAGALEEFGKKSLPAVLETIKFSTSATAKENAVAVWMEVYKHEATKGISSLQEEVVSAEDPSVRENLKRALSKAPTLCNRNERAQCKAAAVIPERK